MLTDFIIVDDVFDNPDEIVEFAKRQKYYSKEEHKYGEKSYFAGLRSDALNEIDEELYHNINNQIFTKCIEKHYPKEFNKIVYGFGFQTSTFFHILYENDQLTPKWWHKDSNCIWAGVIYLNKNPSPNSGTLVNRNNKEIVVENSYNKLVIYSPTYEHTSQGGFGTNIDDGRLTLTFFVNAFQFKIKSVEDEE